MNAAKNYLAISRKRTHLNQSDVAFLLGVEDNSILSRSESGERKPSIETLLFYRLIFDTSTATLYQSQQEGLKEKLSKRIPLLIEDLKAKSQTYKVRQRVAFLEQTLISLKESDV